MKNAHTTLVLLTLLLVTVLVAACGGGAAPTAATAILEATSPPPSTNTPAPTATRAPTNTPVPPTETPTPQPSETPEPTATQEPIIGAEASEFALSLDDLPSGFVLGEIFSYTAPDFEPNFINPDALGGMTSGQGITLSNADIGLGNLFDVPIGIVQVGIVYETIQQATEAMSGYIWRNPDEEDIPASGPKVGDESKSFVNDELIESDEEDNPFGDDVTLRTFATQFRVGNVVATVGVLGLEGAPLADVNRELAEAVEGKLVELLEE